MITIAPRKAQRPKKPKTPIAKERAMRLQFTDWLYEVYNIQEVSTHLFVTLDKVYKGTYKSYKQAIDVGDLWDAWKRKLPQLKEFHLSTFFQQKKLNDVETILYDLGIILKQWDQYLHWQENHPQEVKTAKQEREKLIDYDKFINNQQKQSDDIDLSATLTDIWGDING